ncbi:protein turtle-like isoform X4 [Tigriopus californicus]|uniref:protein turtle-like isoform X4 n=1 Tax=Tigriopus californicus TaxID=6832 RepID=UPI0027DAA7B3|nr:protein turtle-like isoform X4 [Tigriopus californicus]
MSPSSSGRSQRRFKAMGVSDMPTSVPLVLFVILALCLHTVPGFPSAPSEADHITANAGDSVVFNCDVHFPEGKAVPYVVQYRKKGKDLPIYIWYANYPSHVDKEYAGRVSKIDSMDSIYGLASLNITNVNEKDRGWYNCEVLFLNRGPDTTNNGTWYHMDVHAPPYFMDTPDEIMYVNTHDSTILSCEAGGTPAPEILWFKGDKAIQISHRIGVFNDGTELRISNILERDLGDYTCIARNGVYNGSIHFTTKLVMAGAAVITDPPKNQTAAEGHGVSFECKGEANPGNISVAWFKDGIPIQSVRSPNFEASVTSDGTLVIRKAKSESQGRYTCKVSNGIGRPIEATAYLAIEYPARVTYHPDVQYIPRGLQGIIRCYIDSNPPIQFVTWTKDKRIYDPFGLPGVMAMENGSILIDRVTQEHAGDYVCTPYNIHGTGRSSKVMQVIIKDPPTMLRRPEQEYHRSVGDKITMPCRAIGTPKPKISWRRVDGHHLPRKRHKLYNGELTLDALHKSDHGVYECVVENEVATIVARTELKIERTTPHAPTNLTVANSQTFAVTIEWMPGYSGCAACQQTYKIRYREKDSKFPNWIELAVNPPDARKIRIHNLKSNTKYEFQVIGTNEYGDGMYSQIIEAQTKDLSVFNIKLLPRDSNGEIIYPMIPRIKDIPPGEAPPPATNLSLTQEAGGWVLRWQGPPKGSNVSYYTIQIKKNSQGGKWKPLTDQKIDVEEASYMFKNMGTAKSYLFRVFSHSVTSYSISEEHAYDLPENVKRRAVTAGLIGGILFFIVAIVLSVCTVKICNKRRRRKQERAIQEIQNSNVPTYNMVACRLSQTRNGGQMSQQVPLKRNGKSGIPAMRMSHSNSDPHPMYRPQTTKKSLSLRKGLMSMFDQTADCIMSLEERLVSINNNQTVHGQTHSNRAYWSNEPDYSDGKERARPFKLGSQRRGVKYSFHVEYPSSSGNRGLISRSKDGKFHLEDDDVNDEGGFEVALPPNRFRTRSVAIIAGYTSERLYSNMPPGAFVVESGMYKVGADREWERPEPIYWRQVVYGKNGSDGSGTLPKPPHPRSKQVGRLAEEDLKRLRAMEPSSTSINTINGNSSQQNLIRTSNLELVRADQGTAAGHVKLRASSPLDQQVPLTAWMSPIHNYSDVSSVSHQERSIPSTLLTNPTSSLSLTSPNLTAENTASSRSLKNTQRSTDLHTIPEHLPSEEEAPPAYSATPEQNLSVVQADIHHPGLPNQPRAYALPSQHPYWAAGHTYLNADVMFPNYALNYPAPVHGSISPSRQYPDLPTPTIPYWHSLYVQPAVDPRLWDLQNPLATSSPPIREAAGEAPPEYENMKYMSGRRTAMQPPTRPIKRKPPDLAQSRSKQNRHSAVIDGQLANRQDLNKPTVSVSSSSKNNPGTPGQSRSRAEDQLSLVSEVLDAEVTALTNSSSPGSYSNGGTFDGHEQHDLEEVQEAIKKAKERMGSPSTTTTTLGGGSLSQPEESSSSSGIPSKNNSQHQTSSSSSHSTSGSNANQASLMSPDLSSKSTLEPILEPIQPFYENWPPLKVGTGYLPAIQPKVHTYYGYQYVTGLPSGTLSIAPPGAELYLPPLTPHQTLGLLAKPQAASRAINRRVEVTPGADLNTSLDTPPSRFESRPGSSHSAPLLDVSIDRHYEFDARSPTEDLHYQNIREALPRQWNRPYLGYNPRARELELGTAASLAQSERVFSDSEIYSPVFPRGRPEPRENIHERVQAMKKEFQEYRQQQMELKQQQQHQETLGTGADGDSSTEANDGLGITKLESLI